MNISSINTSIAATATQASNTAAPTQASNLISSISNAPVNNVAVASTVATATAVVSTTTPATTTVSVPSPPTGVTATTTTPVANKLNSDWLKIKVTNPLSTEVSRPTTTGDDNKDLKENVKISKTTTPANFVKHKLNVSTASTNSSGNIQIHLIQPSGIISTTPTGSSGISVIQPPNTLTLSGAPKSIIKTSTTLSSPTTTTAVNLAQLSTKSTPASGPNAINSVTTNSNSAINIPTTVNVNNRKINVGPSPANTRITLNSTTPSGAGNGNGAPGNASTTTSTSNTINNLVKNILSSNSPNNAATTNAAVAVTAAASIFSQMNAENGSKIISKTSPPHSIITTLVGNNSTSSGTDSNQTTGDNQQVAQVSKTTNQINLPPTTVNINNSQVQSQLPKITVLSNLGNSNSTTKTIKQAPNRVITTTNSADVTGSNITKTTVPISLKPSSNSTASQHQHLIPINTGSNGQISNIVSGINLKSLSPISFLPANSPNDATASSTVGFVNSKITNLANTRTIQNSTTPPPATTTPITLTNNQPLTISTANISNYISKSTNNTGNVYKTISHINESEDNNNNNNNQQYQPTTVHNFTNSNSQTIAQLCSGLNNQFQIQQGANGTTLQPIRLIQNTNTGQGNINSTSQLSQQQTTSSKIYQNNVQLQQITLNSSMLTTNQQQLGNNNNNSITKKTIPNNNSSVSSTGNIISNMPQSSASPSASPLKPNIIRKPRRDSPNHPNLQNITENQHQILNVQAANLYNQNLTGKHPIYELTQSALIDGNTTINKQTKVHLDNNNQLPAEHQFFSLPSSSSMSSSSTTHHIQLPSSNNPRSILNLIADNNNSNNDATKNIRKFTLNTQLNIPTSTPKDSWASTSSYASSSTAPNNQMNQNNNSNVNNSQINSKKPSVGDMPSSSTLPTSSQSQIQLDKQPTSNTATPTSRKRRKQEFKAKNPENQLVSYNENPLSNNTALAYSVNTLSPSTQNNRYLNENTSINNSIKQSSSQPQNQMIAISGGAGGSVSAQGYYNCGNELTLADVSMYGIEEDERSWKKMRGPDAEEEDYNECLDDETVKLLSKEFSYVASNGVTWTSKKNRSRIAISKCYKTTWKPRNHHYLRYSDIKIKDKAKNNPTIITQKELYNNLNEWKFHFVISQVKNLIGFENESLNVIDDIENLMQDKKFFDSNYSDISIKINESIKANNQRHKHVNEQLDEAQQLIHKLFDHKDKFTKYLLMSSNDKSFNNSPNSSTSHAKNSGSTQAGMSNNNIKSNKYSSGSGNKKGINTRSSQMKNSMHKSNLNRNSAAYGSPKTSKS